MDLTLGEPFLVAFDGLNKAVWFVTLDEGSTVVLEAQSKKSFGDALEKHMAFGAGNLASSTMTGNGVALVFDVGVGENVSDGLGMEPNQSVAREGSFPVGGEDAAVGCQLQGLLDLMNVL